LDEIGDASAEMQLKLLKVVEEGFFKRVGGRVEIKSNARFIFATNRDLKALVEAGKFRLDLYYRIAAIDIEVPPLEERKSDLPEIIRGILRNHLKEQPRKKVAYEDFPDDLLQHLTRDKIPGNIRGIDNDILSLVTFSTMDANGVLNLKDWRRTLGIDVKPAKKMKLDALEMSHLRNLDTNLLTNDFPGMKEFELLLERKILQEAKSKNLTLNEARKILKISKSTLHNRAKGQNLSFARQKGN
jgi:DNA-binding NtrC family response regulator